MAAASEIFPLASRPVSMPRITPFLVKVTDSGLNSLNDALNGSSGGSCITFSTSSGGQIKFGLNGKPFKFTMSDMHKDMSAKGPVEAVEHFANIGRWHKLGLTTYRATIMATDDSYQSTKRKALQAEEEAKKGSAKVLKQPKGSTKASAKMWKKVCDTASVAHRPLTKVTAATAATNSSTTKSPTSANGPCRGLDIRKKSLRERIVHQLLVSCCGPKELLNRMVKEGLTSEERQNFDTVFMAVAQPKNASAKSATDEPVYELKTQCLSEVNDDWPFYSAWHRQLAKRALDSRLSNRSKGPEPTDQLFPERKSATAKCRPYAGSHNAKTRSQPTSDVRQQLATKRPADVGTSDPLPPPPPPPPLPPPSKERRLDAADRKPNSTTDSSAKLNGHLIEAGGGGSHKSGGGDSLEPVRSPSSDISFWDEYPEINTHADRRRYKELFDGHYPQYKQYYDKLKALLDEFTALGDKLKACKQGTAEFDAIQRQIVNRYHQLRADHSLDRLRKQHDTLRSKLSVIKARVSSFDERCESKENHHHHIQQQRQQT